jgi:hypothetical protein
MRLAACTCRGMDKLAMRQFGLPCLTQVEELNAGEMR